MATTYLDALAACFVPAPFGTALQTKLVSRGTGLPTGSLNDVQAQSIFPRSAFGNQMQVVTIAGAAGVPPGAVNDLWNQAFVNGPSGTALQITTGVFVGLFTGALAEGLKKCFLSTAFGTSMQVIFVSQGSAALPGSTEELWRNSLVDGGGGTTALQVVAL